MEGIILMSLIMILRVRCRVCMIVIVFFFFSSRRRHTRWTGDWSSDVCSSDLAHHLDETVLGDRRSHLQRVVLGDGEEQRLLVAEVVEDRAAREAGLVFEAPYRRALETPARERPPRAVEDLAAAGLQPRGTHLRHPATLLQKNRTSVLLMARRSHYARPMTDAGLSTPVALIEALYARLPGRVETARRRLGRP